MIIQNLYLEKYVSKPLCSVVPNAKNKSMQQKDNRSIKYFSVIWKAHSQTFVDEQSSADNTRQMHMSAESLNLSSCRKFCCSFMTQFERKTYLVVISTFCSCHWRGTTCLKLSCNKWFTQSFDSSFLLWPELITETSVFP